MDKNLIIVESPNKIQTIKSYLGSNYEVIASYGHLREMNSKRGYDPVTYIPNWDIIKTNLGKISKSSIIKDIKSNAKKANKIFLATDPDREGEAISWHIYDLLDEKSKAKCCRITFNEITEKAITAAIDNQHELNMNLVHSQFARRIVDRLLGYRLSNFVKRTTAFGRSAGRVQSVALMFIVNRELERRSFVPSKWYELHAKLSNGLELTYTLANARQFNWQPYTQSESNKYNFKFNNEQEAQKALNELTDQFKFVEFTAPKESKGDSYNPITTDKMLQLAGSNLGWSASKTTLVAQKLFEGIELNGQHVGLITYPRTDSQRLNEDFINNSCQFLEKKYGKEYVNFGVDFNNQKTKKSKKNTNQNIQDAHEAIRPVDVMITPESLKDKIDEAEYRLYNMIWSRTMACLMKQPIYVTKGMYFENNNHEFYTSNKQVKFLGYLVLDYFAKIVNQNTDSKLPNLVTNKEYKGKTELNSFDKQPPAYLTEATLIAALKESGVGRPSTYAAMAKISETRGYVNKDGQKLIPTEIGMQVISELGKDFSDIIAPEFTATMETELDKIANGEEIWTDYLKVFTPTFEQKLKEAYKQNSEKKQKLIEDAGRPCPQCNLPLVIRTTKFNTKFVACSGFPKCRYAEFDNSDNLIDENCPECNSQLIKRYNKKGQMFIGCSAYPKCTFIKKQTKTD